tara:strand:- start:2216 stop:2710 length:495 start_codon:yes stop_codon:yes gene_type:complete
MEREPSVFGRFEGYGSPVEITRGGYVMVKVHHQDEAWQLIETLIKAYPGLPKRGSPYPEGHMIRDGLGNTEFVRPDSLVVTTYRTNRFPLGIQCRDGESIAQTEADVRAGKRPAILTPEFVPPTYHGSHIVNGCEYAVRRNEINQLVCDGPYCPVCRPTEDRTT